MKSNKNYIYSYSQIESSLTTTAVDKIWPASPEKKLTLQLEETRTWDAWTAHYDWGLTKCKEAPGSLLKASPPGTAEATPHGGCWPQEKFTGLCLAACRCLWGMMPPWPRWLHGGTDKVRNLTGALLKLIGWLCFSVLIWIWTILKKIVTQEVMV